MDGSLWGLPSMFVVYACAMSTELKFVEKCFRQLGPKNPLRRLTIPDREELWAYLIWFREPTSFEGPVSIDIEALSAFGRMAVTFASKFDVLVDGSFRNALRKQVLAASLLRVDLREFGNELIKATELLGKPGHMSKTERTQVLVRAFEFVKQRLGDYTDEHLADLFQHIRGPEELLANGLPIDFSGDAIRKRR
jgi:hypothetical protein